MNRCQCRRGYFQPAQTLHVDQKRTKRLTTLPAALNLSSMGGVPIDITQGVVGMTVKDLDLEAAFFVTAVPVTS